MFYFVNHQNLYIFAVPFGEMDSFGEMGEWLKPPVC